MRVAYAMSVRAIGLPTWYRVMSVTDVVWLYGRRDVRGTGVYRAMDGLRDARY